MTIPCGRDAAVTPWHRVYGPERLPKLLSGYEVEEQNYWLTHKDNLWYACDVKAFIIRTDKPTHDCNAVPMHWVVLWCGRREFEISRMITIFSTGKPFRGHCGIIQRNALHSWKLLHPDVEVILFGDDDGAAQACLDLGIRYEPAVRRNENGTKYLNDIFDRAYEYSRHSFLCYANCDIMLGADFAAALESVSKTHAHFLMIGRRWDTDITKAWDFAQSDWDNQLRSLALLEGKRNGAGWLDYFCFSRDLYYKKMPPFLIGRQGWDPWLTYFACKNRVPVIDATRVVVAVHQNHDYSYLTSGAAGQHSSAEVSYNLNLGSSSSWHFYSAYAATEILTRECLRRNWLAWLGPVKSRAIYSLDQVWFSFLNVTRPLRHLLGLRRRT